VSKVSVHKFNTHVGVLLSLIAIAVLGRVIPHPPNFTPILSIALVVSAYYSRYISALIVVAALALSDIILGFFWISPLIYLTIGLIAVFGPTPFGHKLTQKITTGKAFFKKVFFVSLGGSLAFFIISNFFVWCFGQGYSRDLTGLLNCYIMAIPFFKNTLMSTLIYSYTLFGISEFLFARHRKVALQHAA